MMDMAYESNDASPFHAGEQAIQRRLGVRDRMERFGRKVIRDYMPQQHRDFYAQLPYIFVAHADKDGWPWASMLYQTPGFISSPHERALDIAALPPAGDPLAQALQPGTRLGLLGIELPTRRRNRLATQIAAVSDGGFSLRVDQAFGNCPQYIQTRELVARGSDSGSGAAPADTDIEDINCFDQAAKALIAGSDTFFVASYMSDGSGAASEGADVSHRGGRPGFIRIDDDKTLTIPDYLGNNHYNTFGNFMLNNKAGLLFVDFENGDLLTLTGSAEILWDSPDTQFFAGAQRLWQFRLQHGRRLKNVLPFKFKLQEFSPNSTLTGTWPEARALADAEKRKHQWLPYTVEKIVQESRDIKSFYLAADGHQAAKFLPGQFLTLKAEIAGTQQIRTYSLSSAPHDAMYRISVKREASPDGVLPAGVFSTYLHQTLREGDTLYAKAPAGSFAYDSDSDRPLVLLAGGVGVTPMISIARHALAEGVRTRRMQPLTFIGAASDQDQRAFFDEFNALAAASKQQIRPVWALSKPRDGAIAGRDYQHSGRLSRELLQSLLPLDDYDCYLCGPAGFMQHAYDLLRSLGVSDRRIYAEAFGPSSLQRDTDVDAAAVEQAAVAEMAVVAFADSGVEQSWSKGDGTLLEFAEAHGLQPEFSCRSGQCGACKVKLKSGIVSYNTEIAADIAEDEVLLCCAMPAAAEDDSVVQLSLGA